MCVCLEIDRDINVAEMKEMNVFLFAFVVPASSLQLGCGRQMTQPAMLSRSRPSMQFASPPNRDDETLFPRDPEGNILITFASLDETAKFSIETAFADRNRERILEGQPKYESIEGMIDAYVEFEGPDTEKNLSRAQCEDAVMRFLQRKALLSEGGAEWNECAAPRKSPPLAAAVY